MENSQSQSKNKKKRLTQEQVRQLEKCFTVNKKLEPDLKLQLSNQLGLPQRQVAVWFQNKRARSKTQSLEVQHCTLQSKLEAALSDKAKLEHQVQFLQDEVMMIKWWYSTSFTLVLLAMDMDLHQPHGSDSVST
ncbi:unnamed protein product [Arabidopsis lyrata]|nr:unnamed protein product [Arabidopsis lyrata]